MLKALLQQLNAFARASEEGMGAQAAARVSTRQGYGYAYEAWRRRLRLAVGMAIQSPDFVSDLTEGLAGVNMYDSYPGVNKKLKEAARKFDAFAEEGALLPAEDLRALEEQNHSLLREYQRLRMQVSALEAQNNSLMHELNRERELRHGHAQELQMAAQRHLR